MPEIHKAKERGDIVLNKKIKLENTYQPLFTLNQSDYGGLSKWTIFEVWPKCSANFKKTPTDVA